MAASDTVAGVGLVEFQGNFKGRDSVRNGISL